MGGMLVNTRAQAGKIPHDASRKYFIQKKPANKQKQEVWPCVSDFKDAAL